MRRRAKIPKELFSEKFRALPIKRKLAVRRGLERRANRIYSTVQGLEKEAQEVLDLTKDFAFSESNPRMAPKQAGQKLNALSGKRSTLYKKILSFGESADKYFAGEFNVIGSQPSFSPNPLAQQLHKAYRMLVLIDTQIGQVRKDIRMWESKHT